MTRGRGRPLVIDWRPEDGKAALKTAYRKERRADVRPRLQALWLLRSGRNVREVAGLVGVHERTVQRWVGWYREGGVAAVRAHRQAGRGQPAFLTAEQQAQLWAAAAAGAFRTAAEAQQWVERQFGVHYRPGGIYALLGRLRIHPKVPRPVNPKADQAAQAAWKKRSYPVSSGRRRRRPLDVCGVVGLTGAQQVVDHFEHRAGEDREGFLLGAAPCE
jgi:transposase